MMVTFTFLCPRSWRHLPQVPTTCPSQGSVEPAQAFRDALSYGEGELHTSVPKPWSSPGSQVQVLQSASRGSGQEVETFLSRCWAAFPTRT